MKNKYRSDLSHAKQLGSAHSGLDHWIKQRVSAVLIVLFTIWLVCFVNCLAHAQDKMAIIEIIRKPYNLAGFATFTLAVLYHGYLGLQVVIEDYVHCRAAKIACLLMMKIILIVTIISFVIALAYIVSF